MESPNPKKIPAIEVTLTTGEVVTVHAPQTKDMGLFINSLGAMTALSKAFDNVAMAEEGIIGLPTSIPAEAMDSIYPLLASMCSVSVEELKSYDLWDGMAILTAMNQLTSKNVSTPEA
jgi:hypothetical protein